MKRISICLACLTCVGAFAQTQSSGSAGASGTRSAPTGPNVSVPSAAPLPTTRPEGITSPTTPNSSSTVGGGVTGTTTSGEAIGTGQTVLEPGVIHEPAGIANPTFTVTNSTAVGRSPATAVESVTTGFTVTNGIVVGTATTNINEPSGAAIQDNANTTASGAAPFTQGFGQRLLEAVNLGSATGQSSPVMMLVAADGSVVLQGTVSSDAERQRIASQIQEVAGVTGVRNELQVSGTGLPTAPQP